MQLVCQSPHKLKIAESKLLWIGAKEEALLWTANCFLDVGLFFYLPIGKFRGTIHKVCDDSHSNNCIYASWVNLLGWISSPDAFV